MHLLFKFSWAIRAIFYGLILGRFKMPGYLGAPLFLYRPKRIFFGKKVRIFPGLRAECHGNGKLIVHDNVSIGQNFHVICSAEMHIGSGCFISGDVFVTDTDHSYDDIDRPIFDQDDVIAPTRIGENCFIGIGARIQAGTKLGDGCIVGSNAVVRGVFEGHCVIAGIPARVIKRHNALTNKWERC